MAKVYGINDLSTKLGIQPGSARVALRKAGIKTIDGRYGWKDKAALEKVIDKLNTITSTPTPKTVAKAVVKKAVAKKSAPKKSKKVLRKAA